MMLLTGVSRVAINYRTPQQRALDRLTLSQARRYLAEGQFPAGSMGPEGRGRNLLSGTRR